MVLVLIMKVVAVVTLLLVMVMLVKITVMLMAMIMIVKGVIMMAIGMLIIVFRYYPYYRIICVYKFNNTNYFLETFAET